MEKIKSKLDKIVKNKPLMLSLLIVSIVVLVAGVLSFLTALLLSADYGGGTRTVAVEGPEQIKEYLNTTVIPKVSTSYKDKENPYGILVQELIGDNTGFGLELELTHSQPSLNFSLNLVGFAKLDETTKDLSRYKGEGELKISAGEYEETELPISVIFDGAAYYVKFEEFTVDDVPAGMDFLAQINTDNYFKIGQKELNSAMTLLAGIDSSEPLDKSIAQLIHKQWKNMNFSNKEKPEMASKYRLACFGGEAGKTDVTLCMNQQNFPLYLRQEFANESAEVNIDFELLFTSTNLADQLEEEITTPASEQTKLFRNLLGFD